MRISNSFSEGEIHVLEFILQTLLRGGKPSTAVRNKDFASLYRKVVSMRTRVEEKKEKTAAKEVSSVGTIGAADDDEDDTLSQVG
ncbi:MAG: hypothetical protein CMN30_19860 [Sandaracinus sp.]|nr:hypothetical protein [Sandaracinus sp.]|tara:strand:+ start:2308 stop:2562 length:255 start_codon:yes stop_codon:yes gene_type:complete